MTGVVNGGFETGDLTGWSLSGSNYIIGVATCAAYTGVYGLRVEYHLWWPTSYCNVYQSVDVTDYDVFSIAGKAIGPANFTVSLDGSVILSGLSSAYTVYEVDISGYTGVQTLQITFGTVANNLPIYYVDDVKLSVTNQINIGDNVLLIPHYGDTYDRACIKGGNVSIGDNVNLYPLKDGPRVAIKERWSLNDKISIRGSNT